MILRKVLQRFLPILYLVLMGHLAACMPGSTPAKEPRPNIQTDSPTQTSAPILTKTPAATPVPTSTAEPTKTEETISIGTSVIASLWGDGLPNTDNYSWFLSDGSGVYLDPDAPDIAMKVHPSWSPHWLIDDGFSAVLLTPDVRAFEFTDSDPASPSIFFYPRIYEGPENLLEATEAELEDLFLPLSITDIEPKEIRALDTGKAVVVILEGDASVSLFYIYDGWQFNFLSSSPAAEADETMPIIRAMLNSVQLQGDLQDPFDQIIEIPESPPFEISVPGDASTYNSAEDDEAWMPPDIPGFSVSFPSDWESSWVGDSGVIAYLIAPDLEKAWFMAPDSFGSVMIFYGDRYLGDDVPALEEWPTLELLDNFIWIEGPLLYGPSLVSINGQDAAIVSSLSYDGAFVFGGIVLQEGYIYRIYATTSLEHEHLMRPIFEWIFTSIVIQGSE